MKARVVAQIVGDDDFVAGDAGADESGGERNAEFFDAVGDAGPEFLVGFVDEPDAGTVSADQVAREGGMQTDQGGDILFAADARGVFEYYARDAGVRGLVHSATVIQFTSR